MNIVFAKWWKHLQRRLNEHCKKFRFRERGLRSFISTLLFAIISQNISSVCQKLMTYRTNWKSPTTYVVVSVGIKLAIVVEHPASSVWVLKETLFDGANFVDWNWRRQSVSYLRSRLAQSLHVVVPTGANKSVDKLPIWFALARDIELHKRAFATTTHVPDGWHRALIQARLPARAHWSLLPSRLVLLVAKLNTYKWNISS